MDVKVKNCMMRGPVLHYGMIQIGETAPLLGSLGYLEIAWNAESAQKILKAKIGSKVELKLL